MEPYELCHITNPNIVLIPGASYSLQDLELYHAHETYQRTRLGGFTVNELSDLGCWDKPGALPTDFTNGLSVHPLYYSGNWQNGTLEVGDEYPGVLWDMRSKVVQDALLPSLRLATMFLTNAHIWPW